MRNLLLISLLALTLSSCTENGSNGERIGVITQFSRTGVIWKSWEGHLNLTQTGMNSSVPFDFSIDNDNEPDGLVRKIDSAANLGWKIKLMYHQTVGKNWFSNRGETNHFVTDCIVLDKDLSTRFENKPSTGRIIDTIYVVIDKSK